MSDPAARPPAADGPPRFLAEFEASRSYLASGLRGPGWFDFGQFNWHDVALGRAIRAALGVIMPLAAGVATGHAAYGSFAALGALPAGFVSFRGVSRTRVIAVAALGPTATAIVTATDGLVDAVKPRATSCAGTWNGIPPDGCLVGPRRRCLSRHPSGGMHASARTGVGPRAVPI